MSKKEEAKASSEFVYTFMDGTALALPPPPLNHILYRVDHTCGDPDLYEYGGQTYNKPRVHSYTSTLAGVQRFAGMLPWSVAQHTLLCDKIAQMVFADRPDFARLQFAIAVHDFHEAVTGDIPSHVKVEIGDAVTVFERRVDAAIVTNLIGTHTEPSPEDLKALHVVDRTALEIEALSLGRDIHPVKPVIWHNELRLDIGRVYELVDYVLQNKDFNKSMVALRLDALVLSAMAQVKN